tara:strand:+ start:210 stop:1100 length:891 start_codon:yes stop_codon:yes gene_type:complete
MKKSQAIINTSLHGPVPNVSFEFFPPKNEQMEKTLWSSIQRLKSIKSSFVSVTYGAGGSTRARTHKTVVKILRETNLIPAAHLTCVDADRKQVDDVAASYWEAGVRKIVALRGDASNKNQKFKPHPEGYVNAADLVRGLKKIADFDITVASYPEIHVDSPDLDSDLDNLKKKIDAGAARTITQLFFDVDIYLKWLEKVRSAGITVPVIPGIMPISNYSNAENFCKLCGATIPRWMKDLFVNLDDDPETRKLVGATVAAEQCRRLQVEGISEFHFYTLNRSDLTYAICHILGLRPQN